MNNNDSNLAPLEAVNDGYQGSSHRADPRPTGAKMTTRKQWSAPVRTIVLVDAKVTCDQRRTSVYNLSKSGSGVRRRRSGMSQPSVVAGDQPRTYTKIPRWRQTVSITMALGAAAVGLAVGAEQVAAAPLTSEQAKLTPSIAAIGDVFGSAIAVSGDTAVVGASQGDSTDAEGPGYATVFVRSGTGWVEQARLTASDGERRQRFGLDVAVSGDTAVIGSVTGAYVFERSGTTWSEQAKLSAPAGSRVTISGDTLIVGGFRAAGVNGPTLEDSGGTAFVFVRSSMGWVEQARLTGSSGANGSGRFGDGLALAGDTAVIGAPYDTNGAVVSSGSAYVFVREGATWTQQAKFSASDAEESSEFGIDVAISGDTIVVGQLRRIRQPDGGLASPGSAYVFGRTGTAWTEQAKLTPSETAPVDNYFGLSVAVLNDSVIVGAFGENEFAGSAYLYERSGMSWLEQAKLTPSDSVDDPRQFFGRAVGLADNAALVGAPSQAFFDRDSSGKVYVFGPEATTTAPSTTTTTPSTTTTTTTTPSRGTPVARPITTACPTGVVPDARFSDVPESATHEDAIECVSWYHVALGYADGSFRPGNAVTRGQMATFVSNVLEAAGVVEPTNPPDAFQDDNGDTHEARINWLVQAGILNGFADGTFRPGAFVNRGQLATYLARAHDAITGQELAVGSITFPDDAGTHQANIRRVAAAGIAAGYADGEFKPGQPTRRDQMASFLARSVDLLVDTNHVSRPG